MASWPTSRYLDVGHDGIHNIACAYYVPPISNLSDVFYFRQRLNLMYGVFLKRLCFSKANISSKAINILLWFIPRRAVTQASYFRAFL